MTEIARSRIADQGQRRASFQQARSHVTKQALVQSAMALWRTNGYAETTVADICRAAGVSKALFYFYFPRKEDVLFEVGMLSTDAAHEKAREVMRKPYDVASVITAVLGSLESTMRNSTPELLLEAILEGYRQAAAGHDHLERTSVIFAEVFGRPRTTASCPPVWTSPTLRTSHSRWSARAPAIGRWARTATGPTRRSWVATSPRWWPVTRLSAKRDAAASMHIRC